MREAEGALFGNAWLKDNFCKSRVRLRLSHWKSGLLSKRNWPKDRSVQHPEVEHSAGNVGSALYLGYGPLTFDRKDRITALKANAAIQAGDMADLSIAWPKSESASIIRALALAGRYGALGGRSRNGWGSFFLSVDEDGIDFRPPVREWKKCLDRDWAHAIGSDESGPLIWQTQAFADWPSLMQELAKIKIGFRTSKEFRFASGNNAPNPESRHWLAYPITNHSVRFWRSFRLPNQLRFCVRPAPGGGKKLVGVIYHMPHMPPSAFRPVRTEIQSVWSNVHHWLDNPPSNLSLARIKF